MMVSSKCTHFTGISRCRLDADVWCLVHNTVLYPRCNEHAKMLYLGYQSKVFTSYDDAVAYQAMEKL